MHHCFEIDEQEGQGSLCTNDVCDEYDFYREWCDENDERPPRGAQARDRIVEQATRQRARGLQPAVHDLVVEGYEKALRRIEQGAVEIVVAREGEFLIGDAPAQTLWKAGAHDRYPY